MPPNREAPFLEFVGSIIYMGIVQKALDPPAPPPSVKQVPPPTKESQNCTGQKCTAYKLVRRQFFNTRRGSAYDLSMWIGHTKFTFALSKAN